MKFPVLFVLLAAAIPLLDLALAVIRRLRLRVSPLKGDRRHFYDLLLARGWSPRSVAVLCYSLTAGLVAAALITRRMNSGQTLVVTVVIYAGLLVAAVRLGALRSTEHPRTNGAMSKVRWQRQSHWPV